MCILYNVVVSSPTVLATRLTLLLWIVSAASNSLHVLLSCLQRLLRKIKNLLLLYVYLRSSRPEFPEMTRPSGAAQKAHHCSHELCVRLGNASTAEGKCSERASGLGAEHIFATQRSLTNVRTKTHTHSCAPTRKCTQAPRRLHKHTCTHTHKHSAQRHTQEAPLARYPELAS